MTHWKRFCKNHALPGPNLTGLIQPDKDLVIAFYGIYLSTGNTIKSQAIQTPTLKKYLNVAGGCSGVVTSYDPNKAGDTTYLQKIKVSPIIRAVINEHHRWESVPNRREPVTKSMIAHWINSTNNDPNSFDSAITDWMFLGSQLGLRKSEWAQPPKNRDANSPFVLNVDGTSKNFISSDFNFHFASDHLDTKNTSTSTNFSEKSQQFDLLKVRWRFQKNNDNGQIIVFSRNIENPDFCVVAAAQRIIARAQRLRVPTHCPIAVYSTKGKLQRITDTAVRRSIQSCAQFVHKLTNKNDITKFTNHSVRVGACVSLHCGGADTLTIKTRLRWRSDSFAMYLRNTPLLAAAHTKILHNTNVDKIVFLNFNDLLRCHYVRNPFLFFSLSVPSVGLSSHYTLRPFFRCRSVCPFLVSRLTTTYIVTPMGE